MTFAEYLKSKGADDATIAAMDTPLAREVFDAMQAKAAEADTLRTNMKSYETKVGEYYETTKQQAEKRDKELMLARAEAARSRAAILSLQEQGLVDVAKDLGFDPKEPPKVEPAAPKYVTEADIMPAINNAGEGLAAVMDAMVEHNRLFPDKPFNARAIRQESVAAGKSFYDYWETKFNVRDARAAYEAKQKTDYESRLREEGAKAEREKLASMYANPNTRPAVPSSSPFVVKKSADGKVEQPWAKSEDQRSDDRVRRATENLIKRGEQATH